VSDTSRENVESWKRNPWSKLPTWAKWTIGVVGALILLSIGAAIGPSNEDSLKSERDEARTEVAQASEDRDRAEAEAEAVQARKAVILSKAKADASRIVGDARSESSKLSSELEGLSNEVGAAGEELSSVEASLNGAEEEKAKSTIPGDGTFRAEVDYIPGTYESSGGEYCYWATLNSADPYDIASNENATGPTIASIQTPYFQTKSCGTWRRIGE
jgi:hypothetical protein